ncbi:MAG TPA: hypothetical protein VGR20_00710, partial [Acidimicrobiia bacterium]|nr:hypothetical protein [Acidimicrobiia bacterium]
PSVVLIALVLLAGLLPVGPALAATDPSLQVTRELTVTATDIATLTATMSKQPVTPTTINFEILNGPGDTDNGDSGTPDKTCVVDPNAQVKDSCSVDIRSGSSGISLVRAWINGTTPDTTEGRLSQKAALLGLGGGDCTSDDGGGLFGGGECENAAETPGGQTEADATDVVQIEWQNFTDGRLNCDDAKPSDGADVEYNNAAVTDRTETYTCTLTTVAGVPIQGAYIDAEIVGADSTNRDSTQGAADYNDLCVTDANGRCNTASKISMSADGHNTICFWGEPAKPKPNQNSPDVGQDDKFTSPGNNTDGGGCNAEPVDEPENNDISDAVFLDVGVPRAEGLDVQPENVTVAGASRFNLRGTVYDQFRQPFKGTTTLQAKLFAGSTLAGNGDNNVATLDPSLKCQTSASETCTILTGAQNDLGQNLACVWIQLPTKTPTAMTGQADQDSATCTAPKALWQSAADQEARVDATVDDGTPFPPTDALDVVRFAVQSKPAIFTVTPGERRQDTSGDVLGIDGINFLPSAQITVSGAGVTLGPTAVVSDKRLEASLAVAVDAAPGPRDVTVTNRSDGGTATCTGCFRVIGQGYWMVASDGGIFAFGDAKYAGSAGSQSLNKPIVAMTPTPSGQGYWMVASDGGIFAFGDAPFVGSAGSLTLTKPIVSMAATPSGRGYWLVASDGGVFGYGDARFFGATSKLTLTKPIVSIVATPSGRGYWLVASDGGIFAFGDARFFGSTGDLVLNQPIVAMAPTRTGKGYWLVATDGGIFAYGDATFYGSTGDIKLNKPIAGMTTTPLGKGYWMVASDGGIFAFGDGRFFGSTGSVPLNKPIVGLARR